MKWIVSLVLLLGVIGCNNSSEGSSKPEPAQSQVPAAGSVPAENKPEEWARSEKIDQMDGTKSVSWTLRSTNKLRYGVDLEAPASFTLRCDKNVSAMVAPGSPLGLVRYKFDASATEAVRWFGNSHSLETSIDSDWVNRLMRAKTFKIELVTGSNAQIATFDLRNIKELIQNEKGCNFRKKAPF